MQTICISAIYIHRLIYNANLHVHIYVFKYLYICESPHQLRIIIYSARGVVGSLQRSWREKARVEGEEQMRGGGGEDVVKLQNTNISRLLLKRAESRYRERIIIVDVVNVDVVVAFVVTKVKWFRACALKTLGVSCKKMKKKNDTERTDEKKGRENERCKVRILPIKVALYAPWDNNKRKGVTPFIQYSQSRWRSLFELQHQITPGRHSTHSLVLSGSIFLTLTRCVMAKIT